MSLKRLLHPEPDDVQYESRREQRRTDFDASYGSYPTTVDMTSRPLVELGLPPMTNMPMNNTIPTDVFYNTDINMLPPSDFPSFDFSQLDQMVSGGSFPQNPFGSIPDGFYDQFNLLEPINSSVQAWSQNHQDVSSSPQTQASGETGGTTPNTEPNLNNDGSLFVEQREDNLTATDSTLICYGMLYQLDLKLYGETPAIDQELSTSPNQQLIVKQKKSNMILSWPDEQGMPRLDFGYLTSTMIQLGKLFVKEGVFIEAPIPARQFRDLIAKAKKSSDVILKVDLNIYGPEDASDFVKSVLSEGRMWLQRPDHARKNIPYKNPQFVEFQGVDFEPTAIQTDLVQQRQPTQRPENEQLAQFVSSVYNSLNRGNHLRRTDVHRELPTTLLDHQQEALSFMLQRESGDIPDEYRLWKPKVKNGLAQYSHVITNQDSRTRPEENGGGLLADEMGMGKSLSILALIVNTLENGQQWAEAQSALEGNDATHQYVRGTLILVTSSLLINNWLQEIQQHLGGLETVSTVRYHGPGRNKMLEKIHDADIVITTYNTLAMERNKKSSPLHRFGWYRVVLDEAHMIRRQTTQFHKNCADFMARSRWCLTGTPIQNSLDDIGALFAFIKAKPFDNPAVFRRCISKPFKGLNWNDKNQRKIIEERLVKLLDSLVIRRTRASLDLPKPRQVTRDIELSPEEAKQYKKTHDTMLRTIKQRVGQSEQTAQFSMFHLNLQLRILCNHGTYQKPLSWKRKSVLDMTQAIVCSLDTNAEKQCSVCRLTMPIVASMDVIGAFVEGCRHAICHECLESSPEELDSTGKRYCPLCNTVKKTSTSTYHRQPEDGRVQASSEEEEEDDDTYFATTGHSSKMTRLLADIKQDLSTTKSIVFSCWTRTLTLIARHLERDKVPYLRIDGTCTLSRRQGILDEFAMRPDHHILLMTTGTGAFGLNLACANRVFLVEPQWNPSVEHQAIARATRIGQTQRVTVIRYFVKGTVEKELLDQQKYKTALAKLGSDRLETSDDIQARTS